MLDLRHHCGVVESGPVPFEQREFGVVPPTVLGIAKRLAQLINIAAAGGQQALHREFRRWAQEDAAAHAGDLRDQGFDVRIAEAGCAQQGRFDLEHAPGGEEFPGARQQVGAPPQGGQSRGGPPIRTGFATHSALPMACPNCTTDPARSNGCQRARLASNNRITVEPMLNRPSSAPFSSVKLGAGIGVTARRAAGVISPAQTVAMLPTFSAPTSTTANWPHSPSNSVSTRSLRANRRATCCAVVPFTLNRRPGTYTVSSNRPAIG